MYQIRTSLVLVYGITDDILRINIMRSKIFKKWKNIQNYKKKFKMFNQIYIFFFKINENKSLDINQLININTVNSVNKKILKEIYYIRL